MESGRRTLIGLLVKKKENKVDETFSFAWQLAGLAVAPGRDERSSFAQKDCPATGSCLRGRSNRLIPEFGSRSRHLALLQDPAASVPGRRARCPHRLSSTVVARDTPEGGGKKLKWKEGEREELLSQAPSRRRANHRLSPAGGEGKGLCPRRQRGQRRHPGGGRQQYGQDKQPVQGRQSGKGRQCGQHKTARATRGGL